MEFIKLKDGSKVRADLITVVRFGDGRAADQYCCELKPHVIVDFSTGNHHKSIVLYCETDEERNALSDSIMAEIEAANTKAAAARPVD